MATVRELITKFGLDYDQSNADKADKAISSLKNAARGLASAFAVIKVGSFLKESVMAASHLADGLEEASQRTGVTTQALQELGFAAKQTGVDSGALEGSMRILSRNMAAAKGGSKGAQEAFKQLGVSVTGAGGQLKATDQVLMEAADQLSQMPDGAAKSALAMQVFGKQGAALIPLLNQGSKGIRAQRQEAQALGIVLGDDAVKQGAKFQDNMDKLDMTFQAIKVSIGNELIPTISKMVTGFMEWYKANRELVQGKIVATMKVVAVVIKGVANGIMTVVGTIIEIGRSVASLGPVLRTLILIGLAIAGIFLLPELAIAAMIALIFLLIDDVVNFMNGNKSVIGEIVDSMSYVWDQFTTFLADKIEVAVDKIKMFFTDLWEWVKIQFDNILQLGTDMVNNLVGLFTGLFDLVTNNPITRAIGKFTGIGGGAASPQAAATQNAISNVASNRVSGSVQTTNQISIVQQPGQSSKDLANDVALAIEERNQALFRQTLDQLTYGVSQ